MRNLWGVVVIVLVMKLRIEEFRYNSSITHLYEFLKSESE